MRTPQTTLTRIFESLKDLDHNDINTLAALNGRMVTIPVRLEYKEEKLAQGTVTLSPLRSRMEFAAVYLFENVLINNGLHLFWDKAIAGPDNFTIDPGKYLAQDNLVHEMLSHDRGLSLRDNLAAIKNDYDQRLVHGTPPTEYEQGFDLCAAIVANTAIIRSEDLERVLFNRKSAFEKFYGFWPHKLEF